MRQTTNPMMKLQVGDIVRCHVDPNHVFDNSQVTSLWIGRITEIHETGYGTMCSVDWSKYTTRVPMKHLSLADLATPEEVRELMKRGAPIQSSLWFDHDGGITDDRNLGDGTPVISSVEANIHRVVLRNESIIIQLQQNDYGEQSYFFEPL